MTIIPNNVLRKLRKDLRLSKHIARKSWRTWLQCSHRTFLKHCRVLKTPTISSFYPLFKSAWDFSAGHEKSNLKLRFFFDIFWAWFLKVSRDQYKKKFANQYPDPLPKESAWNPPTHLPVPLPLGSPREKEDWKQPSQQLQKITPRGCQHRSLKDSLRRVRCDGTCGKEENTFPFCTTVPLCVLFFWKKQHIFLFF